jgi:hypothetical protein
MTAGNTDQTILSLGKNRFIITSVAQIIQGALPCLIMSSSFSKQMWVFQSYYISHFLGVEHGKKWKIKTRYGGQQTTPHANIINYELLQMEAVASSKHQMKL